MTTDLNQIDLHEDGMMDYVASSQVIRQQFQLYFSTPWIYGLKNQFRCAQIFCF